MQKVVLLMAVILGRPAVAQKPATPVPRQSAAPHGGGTLSAVQARRVGADNPDLFVPIHTVAQDPAIEQERRRREESERRHREMIKGLFSSPIAARNKPYGIGQLRNPPGLEPGW